MGNRITRRGTLVDERYTRPQGLCHPTDIDEKKLRRLILDAKLAPCYPGTEDFGADLDECPICFMFYPSLNRSKCCTKGICTECFLRVKSPQAACPTQCPFCKTSNYAVEYRGVKSMEERGIEQAEEQKVIEAKIRMRQKELQDEDECMQRREARHEEEEMPPMRESSPEESCGLGQYISGRSETHPEEVVTCNPEGTASGHSVEGNLGRILTTHHQETQLPGFSFMRINRNEDFDFDFDMEDIMVMEAIWLSIQDLHHADYVPVSQQDTHSVNNSEDEALIYDQDLIVDIPVSSSASTRDASSRNSTGGLVGAIAALAEKQVLGVHSMAACQSEENHSACENRASIVQKYQLNEETSIGNDIQNTGNKALLNCNLNEQPCSRIDRHVESEAEQGGSTDRDGVVGIERNQSAWLGEAASSYSPRGVNSWLEISASDLKDGSSSTSELGMYQSSEDVEVGTSISSSIPSASDLPWEPPDMPLESLGGAVDPQALTTSTILMPETFEEQMMLAMALSVAEAQAHSR